jgi:hypothetical protein
MGNFFNYIIPKFGVFYNGYYGIKGYCWLGKIKGIVIRSNYPKVHQIGNKVVISSKTFRKINYTKDFPFDLYDRY